MFQQRDFPEAKKIFRLFVILTVSKRYRTEIANPSSVLNIITNKNVAIHIDPSMKLNLLTVSDKNEFQRSLIGDSLRGIWTKTNKSENSRPS